MGKRYDPAFMQQVCARLVSRGPDRLTVAQAAQEYGVSQPTLQSWLSTTPLPPPALPAPPLPSGLNLRQAIYISSCCAELGFDSLETVELCRERRCTVDEIKAFWDWAELYGEETLVQLVTLPQQLESVLEQGQRLKQRAAELKEAIAAKDAQIAQLRSENEQSRLKHKQMLASLSSTESQKPAQKRRGAK